MKQLEKHYNKLVKKFHKMETDTAENEIHDKRVILRRVFPILGFYKMNSAKVKFGAVAFGMFGKLRDIQVQKLKLEKMEQPNEWTDYLQHLKELEIKNIKKVGRFSRKKRVKFPTLKASKIKAYEINENITAKAKKNLSKLIANIQLPTLEKAGDIHNIRIAFKKFRYTLEVLSYIEQIDAAKLEKLEVYQDMLGEIQDCEVLTQGITRFYRKNKAIVHEKVQVFESEKNQRIERFNNDKEKFIEVCSDILDWHRNAQITNLEH